MVWQLCTGNGTPGWGSIQIASMGLYLLTVWVLGVQLLLLLDPQFFCLLCLSELTCHQSRFKDWERVICVTSKHWYHWDGSTIYLPPHEKCNQYKQPPQHCQNTWPSPQTSPFCLVPHGAFILLVLWKLRSLAALFICTSESTHTYFPQH